MKKKILLERIAAIEMLPGMKRAVFELEKVFQDPEGGIPDVVKIIRDDPAIAAGVMKIANSASFGIPGRHISTLLEGVSRIGLKEVQHISLATGVFKSFQQGDAGLDLKSFWLHALVVSRISSTLIIRLPAGVELIEQAYLAGLLHDIGMLVLDRLLPKEYRQAILDNHTESKTLTPSAERELFGIDHAEAGALLLQNWNFSESIVDAVRHHHEPYQTEGKKNILAVGLYLADFQACAAGAPPPGEGVTGEDPLSYWTDLNLDAREMENMIVYNDHQVQECKEFLDSWKLD